MRFLKTCLPLFLLICLFASNLAYADTFGDVDSLDEFPNGTKENSGGGSESDSPAVDTEKKPALPDKVMMIDKTKGGKEEYFTARIAINGEILDSDVPAILYKINGETRTLVPIRVISESLGGEVKWENDVLKAKIFYKGKVVELKIDSTDVIENGVAKPLPSGVPAKLMSYIDIQRTMVPVRFISEAFGAKVNWDNDNRIVDITRKVVSEEPSGEVKKLPTLIGAKFNTQTKPITLKLEFSENIGQELNDFVLPPSDGAKDRLVIDINGAVMGLTGKDGYDGKTEQYTLDSGDAEILCLRSAQLGVEPYVTRVVVDMAGNHEYVISKDDKSIDISFGKKIDTVINRGERNDSGDGKNGKKNYKDLVAYQVIKDGEFAILRMKKEVGNIKVLETGPEKLQLEIPSDMVLTAAGVNGISDRFVKNWEINNYESIYLINYYLQDGVVVYENPKSNKDGDKEFVFEIPDPNRKPGEGQKLVVYDPGHGGPDPGAVSKLDSVATSEVDVLNNIVPMIKDLTEADGYKVLLTRDEDIEVSLFQRVKYAELVGADVLASVHANAGSSSAASGIEVFAKKESAESCDLGDKVINNMVAISGDKSRGVKDYDLFITREASMPSILVELGFLTNPGDLKKLRDINHLKLLAKGIADGVRQFLEK